MNIGLKTLKDKNEKTSNDLNSLIAEHTKLKNDVQNKLNEIDAKMKEYEAKIQTHDHVIDSIVNN